MDPEFMYHTEDVNWKVNPSIFSGLFDTLPLIIRSSTFKANV